MKHDVEFSNSIIWSFNIDLKFQIVNFKLITLYPKNCFISTNLIKWIYYEISHH